MIRSAKLQDRSEFMRLWANYMTEQEKEGSHVVASLGNIYRFVDYFESYTAGSLFGICLFFEVDEEPVGLALAGELNVPDEWETTLGKIGTLWGVYVDPPFRGRGISTKLFAEGLKRGLEMGFDTLESYIRVDNAHGLGAAKVVGTSVYVQQHLFALRDPKILSSTAAQKGLAREVRDGT